jgi:hypothetical protein
LEVVAQLVLVQPLVQTALAGMVVILQVLVQPQPVAVAVANISKLKVVLADLVAVAALAILQLILIEADDQLAIF